eukprot:1457228-Amphidinium_carterae.1
MGQTVLCRPGKSYWEDSTLPPELVRKDSTLSPEPEAQLSNALSGVATALESEYKKTVGQRSEAELTEGGC